MSTSTAMNSGLDEIRQIFITECNDGLDVIETGLLDLEKGTNNRETINDIFRGAHSIKGGAATFGYSNIADFTHAMETLLDKLRSNELAISPPLVQLFLESVDCLREMVESMDEPDAYDKERTLDIQSKLKAWVSKGGESEAAVETGNEPDDVALGADGGEAGVWKIKFKPKPDFLATGNQPQHIFRALSDLGKVALTPDYSAIPEFKSIDPTKMYLGWTIRLEADDADEAAIREVFDWVEMESDIEISQLSSTKKPATTEVVEFDRRQDDRRTGDRRSGDRRGNKKESSSIRVDIEKIDVLLNLVGEMVINQAMLNQLSKSDDKDREMEQALSLLNRTTRELQEAVMEIRMLPISVTFSRFPRLVHDLSAKLDKKVELIITGEQTELDKTVLEKIGDPLLHLIRNSLDHGIESPEKRLEKGKDETGVIHLSASHEGGSVVIRVTDDGSGLDTDKILSKAREKGLVEPDQKMTESQIHDLVFHPGFSTADQVTDVSGRGVGMDVVRSNIEEIGGRVDVYSERNSGSTFQITLPLTLAILDGQLIRVSNQIYVLPLLSIVETVQVKKERINVISGREVVYRLRGNAIPVIDMRTICRIPGAEPLKSYENKQLIIVESDRRSIGLVVDELLDQHQVVIKSLETNYVKVPGMLGATILGDGTVSLILDVTTFGGTLCNGFGNHVEH